MEDSWHMSSTVPHGHLSYRNLTEPCHAQFQAAAAPLSCLLSHHHTLLHFFPKHTDKKNQVPCLSTCPIWKSNVHVSLQAIVILMSCWNGDERREMPSTSSFSWDCYVPVNAHIAPHKENCPEDSLLSSLSSRDKVGTRGVL